MTQNDPPWWLADALAAGPRGLEFDGIAVADLAARHGTPLYVYSAATIRRRLAELHAALRSTGAPYRIHYAMKANRFRPLLELFHGEADVGIDCCSPREVALARSVGFAAQQISVTAGMLSDRDLGLLLADGVHLNLDTRSVLRRLAALAGPVAVGLRINPEVAIGWGQEPKLSYGNSKFGFDGDAVLDAAQYAASLGLTVDTLHMHPGWGLQASAAPALAGIYARLAQWSRALPTVKTINIGGGLCWRQRAEDQPLAPATWAELLRTHLAPTGCTIACEPGTFLMASAGLLVTQINTVEPRRAATWLGIDAGHNINLYPAHYGIPLALLPVAQPEAPACRRYHLAGNINEANDVFARDAALPEMREGDLLALYPTGAYGASMASDHCLRGWATEVLV